jgi:hypothetical protein
MSEGFFDMPSGYSDADLEMADLEDRGRRASKRYRGFGRDWFDTRDRLANGETVTTNRRNPDTGEPYAALARMVDEDEVGPIVEYSVDDGASWHTSCAAARKAGAVT